MARPRYAPPTICSLSSEQVGELLGPAESQYVMTTSGSNCLPLVAASTVQDNWQFKVPVAPTRVTIRVDVTDATCATPAFASCSGLLAPGSGPLDPKFALYAPGVAPAAGPFNGLFQADCGTAPDTGCGPKPANACFICDNVACADPAVPGSVCGTLTVNLATAGTWTLAVAPQAPSIVPQAQGCYTVTVTAETGKQVGTLALVGNDTTVTFRP